MNQPDVQTILQQYRKEAPFESPVVYLTMEIAIDQCLKTYSGGLGFLAGSDMRSAYALRQNIICVSMLWEYSYYEQVRDEKNEMRVQCIEKDYTFLVDTGIVFPVKVDGSDVYVKAWLLPPDTFQTAPIFFLSCDDLPQNDYLSDSITHQLYDSNEKTRIAQSIVLGRGAHILMKTLNMLPETWHLNEAHGLPLIYSLFEENRNWEEVKKHTVFTTHTPERAGNEFRNFKLLFEMGFFGNLSWEDAWHGSYTEHNNLDYTRTAIIRSRKQNAVSKLHGEVCKDMYGHLNEHVNLISITNAQQVSYWQDKNMRQALLDNNDEWLRWRKKECKKELFEIVADQTGNIFSPDVLTIVWARRFAEYKRAWLIQKDFERFLNLVNRTNEPVQIIWAGKPYPESGGDVGLFNSLIRKTKHLKRCAVLTGYELGLSAKLKKGADIWLNTPRYTREASGTSGMSAAMNGALNFTVDDGWIPEFAKHNENAFVIPHADPNQSIEYRDEQEYQSLISILENEVVPMYYNNQVHWTWMVKNSMHDVAHNFNSDRMAREYYEKLYLG